MLTLTRVTSGQEFLPWFELLNEPADALPYFPPTRLSDQALNYPPIEQSGSVIYAIHLGTRPAGWCQLSQRGKTLFIEGLFIRACLRRRGLGHRTMHQIEYCAPQTVNRITLKVHQSNPSARRLYLHCKFVTFSFEGKSGFYWMGKRRRSGFRCGVLCQHQPGIRALPAQPLCRLPFPDALQRFKAG